MNTQKYYIIGRFEQGIKYGINTKLEVEGYALENEPVAIRKNGAKWQIDHMPTGLQVSYGYNTRKAAIADYENHYKEIIDKLSDDYLRKAIEHTESMPTENEVEEYEELDIVALSDGRLDDLTAAANRRGCIIRKVEGEEYQHGGHIKIYGDAWMLEEVIEMKKKMEARQAEQIEAEKPEEINLDKLTPDMLTPDMIEMLLMQIAKGKDNNSIILRAGIEAGAVHPMELVDYLRIGRMPKVHTFDVWKKAGYTVRKGEKHAFSARIWKYVDKSETLTAQRAGEMNAANMTDGISYNEGDTISKGDYIKKVAYFFGFAQVEKTPEPAALPELPEDVKKETKNGCTWISGNTRPIKDDLKAAGFRWSKKNSAWYRRDAA